MKKALVVFLLFALVGTGAFAAPTFLWQGHVDGGVAMMNFAGDDDPVFGTIASQAWVDGIRTQIQFSFTNAAGNAGIRYRMRAQGGGAAYNTGIINHQGWAWVDLFGGLLHARGGRVHDDVLSSVTYEGWTLFNNQGLLLHLNPLGDMLTLAAGAFTGESLDNGSPWDAGQLNAYFGARVNLVDLVDVRAQLTHSYAATHALASLGIRALPGIPINFAARFWDLNDFGDTGVMALRLHAAFNIIDNVSLNFKGGVGTNAAADDPHFFVGGWAHIVMGDLMPRIDIYYTSGGAYIYTYGLNAVGSIWDSPAATFNADQSFLSIRPALRFRTTPTSWLEVGCLFNIDLGDVSAVGGSETGTTWGAFASVRVTF